jgi:hypothetical protein
LNPSQSASGELSAHGPPECVADCHAKIGSVLNQAGLLNWLIPFLTYALRIARFTVGVKKTLRYSNVFFYNRTTKEERDAVYHRDP